jgi:hypothetical protein
MSPLAAPIVSALAALVGLFFAWRKLRDDARKNREDSYRRGDVLGWANEVIGELQTLLLICILKEEQVDVATSKAKLTDIIFSTSILVERGRLFFKNEIVDSHGSEKEPAYQGYRPKILDPIVVAHQIACEWRSSNRDKQLRMRLIAEDCLKKFVSLVQKEVGRGVTASADTSQGGDGRHLAHLLYTVNEKRLEKLKRTGR